MLVDEYSSCETCVLLWLPVPRRRSALLALGGRGLDNLPFLWVYFPSSALFSIPLLVFLGVTSRVNHFHSNLCLRIHSCEESKLRTEKQGFSPRFDLNAREGETPLTGAKMHQMQGSVAGSEASPAWVPHSYLIMFVTSRAVAGLEE